MWLEGVARDEAGGVH
jgi:hypothetical protein